MVERDSANSGLNVSEPRSNELGATPTSSVLRHSDAALSGNGQFRGAKFREEPHLHVQSSPVVSDSLSGKKGAINGRLGQRSFVDNGTSSTVQLLAERGGKADLSPNDEMNQAIEQIRLRHQSDMQREQRLQERQGAAPNGSISLVKDITKADNTTEFLLLSLQRCLNLKPQQVQRLLTNSNAALIESFEQGLPVGDFSKLNFWLEYLQQETIFSKMIRQLSDAFAAGQDIDAILILGATKCGLYSQNEYTAKLTL